MWINKFINTFMSSLHCHFLSIKETQFHNSICYSHWLWSINNSYITCGIILDKSIITKYIIHIHVYKMPLGLLWIKIHNVKEILCSFLNLKFQRICVSPCILFCSLRPLKNVQPNQPSGQLRDPGYAEPKTHNIGPNPVGLIWSTF